MLTLMIWTNMYSSSHKIIDSSIFLVQRTSTTSFCPYDKIASIKCYYISKNVSAKRNDGQRNCTSLWKTP